MDIRTYRTCNASSFMYIQLPVEHIITYDTVPYRRGNVQNHMRKGSQTTYGAE
jgi:hypothetical protein